MDEASKTEKQLKRKCLFKWMIGDKKIKKIEIIILVALYLVLLSFWTLTFRMNPIPYGEPDAAIHFRLADEMYLSDKPLVEVPKANPLLGFDVDEEAGHFTIAPQHHTNIALMEIIGGERIIPFFLYIAIACSLIFFTVFFFAKKAIWTIAGFSCKHIYNLFNERKAYLFMGTMGNKYWHPVHPDDIVVLLQIYKQLY